MLIPDYNNNGTWAWDDRIFESGISGGSAVMWAPGKIMKSGGLAGEDGLAHTKTETIDLSNAVSGSYDSAPDFTLRQRMSHPRHLHTLTLLADGRVMTNGGNARANGTPGDSLGNDCFCPPDDQSSPVVAITCNGSNQDGVPEGVMADGCPAFHSFCNFDTGLCSQPFVNGEFSEYVPKAAPYPPGLALGGRGRPRDWFAQARAGTGGAFSAAE